MAFRKPKNLDALLKPNWAYIMNTAKHISSAGFPLKPGHQMEYPMPNTTIQYSGIQGPIALSSIQVSTEVRLLITDY